MDALAAIAARHSTREFSDRPVPRQVLEQIVDAGRRAPTARNEQPWEFVVVTDRVLLRRMGEATDHGRFIAQSTACIVVFCREGKYYLEDGCAATENMLVAATALGVQSCWVAGDKKPYCAEISAMLGAPAGLKLVALLAMGYGLDLGCPKRKRELAEVLHWEGF